MLNRTDIYWTGFWKYSSVCKEVFQVLFLGKKRGTQREISFTGLGSRSVWKISNYLNIKHQMRVILRLRHLNLGVCKWSRELISTHSTQFPAHKHLWLWVHVAPNHGTLRTSHLVLHAHIQSAFLPVWRIERKCYISYMLLQYSNGDKSFKEQFWFLLLILFSSYMAVFQILPGNKLIHTFLHSSALVRDSFPSGFGKIEHQRKYFSHFPAVVKAFFFLKKKPNQNLLTPFHYSVFNFNIFSLKRGIWIWGSHCAV